MAESAFSDQAFIIEALSRGSGHLRCRLKRLSDPAILWVNWDVASDDPEFKLCGGQRQAYEAHLLATCAVIIAGGEDSEELQTCTVDRYGGANIGRNGGSGRAALVAGYHLKGIGRTPLVGIDSDQAHSSGGAYLEECVREVVATCISSAEFPFGVVPILAVIDTGEIEVWRTNSGDIAERRCILVRPPFLRPAHFMRAPLYKNADMFDGKSDSARVSSMFAKAAEHWGSINSVDHFRTLWLRWAAQLSYGYVARLSHGSGSPSNISLDGRLLDFGGITTLPSLARFITMQGDCDVGEEMRWLQSEIESEIAMMKRYAPQGFVDLANVRAAVSGATRVYLQSLYSEFVRLLGFSTLDATSLLKSQYGEVLVAEIRRYLAETQRRKFEIFKEIPQLGFDLSEFWSGVVPESVSALRRAVGVAANHVLSPCDVPWFSETLICRHRLRTRTRRSLFRDNIKSEIYTSLDGKYRTGRIPRAAVSAVINREIAKGRGDSRFEHYEFEPVGFFRGNDGECVIGTSGGDGSLFAHFEWSSIDTLCSSSVKKLDSWSSSHVEVERTVLDGATFFIDGDH